MADRYVAGTSNRYFPKHKYHGIPLNRSILPISDYKVSQHVGPDAKLRKAVEVEILTAEHLWWAFQQEAEDLIKEDGQLVKDPRARNRRINAAYAKLWLADQRFQWAGLASFASKQVGCGLLHAQNVASKYSEELKYVPNWAGSSTDAAGMSAVPTVARNGSTFMYDRLGFGNMYLFLDIYPLHRFYMERGWKEFDSCLAKRAGIADRVDWSVDKDAVPFGKPFEEIRQGFRQIEMGNVAESVRFLAQHEQVNILQAIMYQSREMQLALDANQFSWATRFPTGDYSEIQLTLSAQCRAKTGLTTLFPNKWSAKLYVVEQRMAFVNQAAAQFDQLVRGQQRTLISRSLEAIYNGGGVQ